MPTSIQGVAGATASLNLDTIIQQQISYFNTIRILFHLFCVVFVVWFDVLRLNQRSDERQFVNIVRMVSGATLR